MKKNVLIFFPYPLEPRGGGPATYLHILKQSLQANTFIIFLDDLIDVQNKRNSSSQKKSSFKWTLFLLPEKLRNSIRVHRYLKQIKRKSAWIKKQIEVLSLNTFDIIHFHSALDVWLYGNLPHYTGKILLTSHSPVPFHIEFLENTFGIGPGDIYKSVLSQVESIDVLAFSKVDGLILPHEKSMEAYSLHWKKYPMFEKTKKFYYVMTGAPATEIDVQPDEIRKALNIPSNAFVICYNARHSYFKGFDLLVSAANSFLNQTEEIYVVVTGSESHLKGLMHDRWIELGWIKNPGSLVNAANLLIVPNRATFFDLNVIEAMSIGKFVLLSKTGGNKFFENVTHIDGVGFFEPESIESLLTSVVACFEQREQMEEKGKKNFKVYQKNFLPSTFGQKYEEVYDAIICR